MTILNRIASNWSFQEREKLNNNWSIIESYLSKLQGQINILTGDVNVQDIVDQINNLLNQGNIVIADLEAALQDATTVITNAQNATTDANNAAQDALNAINDMQAFINQFGNAESYDNSKLYKVNNMVEYDGSGFICIKETQGNPPPTPSTKRNEWWQLFAQKGTDGTGAVSKVAGRSPELDGNVPLTAQDIGATSTVDFDARLANIVNVKSFGAVGDGMTDDTNAIQQALNQSSLVIVPNGTYLISETLRIPSNTYLLGVGRVVIKRNANILALLINDSDGTKGFYDATENVTIENITFDGNRTGFPTNVSTLAFGHMRNLNLINLRIVETFGWHNVEINSSENVLIDRCVFDGLTAETGNEMLQIDLAYSSGVFPWFGPWDNTPCKNITIRDCNIRNGVKGIGTHSAHVDFPHSNIKIINTKFENLSENGITPWNWNDVSIEDCYFENCYHGIYVDNPYLNLNYTIFNCVIKNNVQRGIFISRNANNIKIINNHVSYCGTHGISTNAIQNLVVDGNTVNHSGQTGIYIYGSSLARIINNYAYQNGQSLASNKADMILGYNSAQSSNYCQVKNNTVTNFLTGVTKYCIIRDNIFTNVTQGADNQNLIYNENFVNNVWVA